MKSSIRSKKKTLELESLTDWETLKQLLPTDLEESAVQMQALRRRRAIQSAGELLRICLMYAVQDWSFRMLGVWCTLCGLCHVSDVALLQRVRQSRAWLSHLVAQMLKERMRLRPRSGMRLRIIDGSGISQPGSKGTDWRLHISFDLEQMCLDEVELTGASGGECLDRFHWQQNDIVLADRGFAYARSIGAVLIQGARLVVRPTWQNLPLYQCDGERFDITKWLQTCVAPAGSPQEILLCVPTPQGQFLVRFVAAPLPQEAADRARQRAQKAAKKQGRQPDARTLVAAGFLFALTNLPKDAWSSHEVLLLYRARWQVELAIKRLKSLLHFDRLRTQEPELAQSYLLAKLLASLLVARLLRCGCDQPRWLNSTLRPLSIWRLSIFFWDQLLSLIKGHIHLGLFVSALPLLARYFRNSPRQRSQQDALLRAFFASPISCDSLS